MTHPTGGAKRSSWLTFRRRLLLVRLLLRDAAGTAELIAAVQAELGDEGYPQAAAAALKHDLDALKAEYGYQIGYQRDAGPTRSPIGDADVAFDCNCMHERSRPLNASVSDWHDESGPPLPKSIHIRIIMTLES